MWEHQWRKQPDVLQAAPHTAHASLYPAARMPRPPPCSQIIWMRLLCTLGRSPLKRMPPPVSTLAWTGDPASGAPMTCARGEGGGVKCVGDGAVSRGRGQGLHIYYVQQIACAAPAAEFPHSGCCSLQFRGLGVPLLPPCCEMPAGYVLMAPASKPCPPAGTAAGSLLGLPRAGRGAC